MGTIVITGASSGIGYALAETLIARDNFIVAIARREQKLIQLKNKYPEHIRMITADVSDIDDREKIINQLSDIPQINALVHNAGTVTPIVGIQKIKLEQWRHTQATNVEAPLFLTQALIPQLTNGRILHVSTAAAHMPFPTWSAYCTSKAALFMLYQCLNMELADLPLSVGSVMPGIVDTAMQGEIRESEQMPEDRVNFFQALKESNKLVPAETVARFLSWLLLDIDSTRFAAHEWDIYDTSHHNAWLKKSFLPEL